MGTKSSVSSQSVYNQCRSAEIFFIGCFAFFFSLLKPAPVLANKLKVITVVQPLYRQAFNSVQRRWEDDALLSRGTRLNPEDRLIRKGRGMASILCQSGAQNFKTSDYVTVSSFCESQRAAPVQAIIGAQDPSLPYLLEPRISLVRGPTPTVRWNPVPGVRSYRLWLVRLRDRQLLWGPVIDSSRINLPAHLNLMAGESYQLVVEADNGTSSRLEPLSARLRFGVLPSAEAQQLEHDLAEIRSLRGPGVTPQSLVLLEASALEQRGLVAEAISLLDQQERQNPSLEGQLQLGRLASLQGLNQLAQNHFRQANALASQGGDAEGGREAREGEQRADRLAASARQGTGSRSQEAEPTTPAAP